MLFDDWIKTNIYILLVFSIERRNAFEHCETVVTRNYLMNCFWMKWCYSLHVENTISLQPTSIQSYSSGNEKQKNHQLNPPFNPRLKFAFAFLSYSQIKFHFPLFNGWLLLQLFHSTFNSYSNQNESEKKLNRHHCASRLPH